MTEEAAVDPATSDADDSRVYRITDTSRRRQAGLVYIVGAVGCGTLIAGGALSSAMWWTVVVPLIAVGSYHQIAAWTFDVREGEALETANRHIGLPIGHASATVGFAGWRARPVWNVLVFNTDEPPSRQGLVRVDGVDGDVLDSYVEEVEQ